MTAIAANAVTMYGSHALKPTFKTVDLLPQVGQAQVASRYTTDAAP
jgi:hypothetical protein